MTQVPAQPLLLKATQPLEAVQPKHTTDNAGEARRNERIAVVGKVDLFAHLVVVDGRAQRLLDHGGRRFDIHRIRLAYRLVTVSPWLRAQSTTNCSSYAMCGGWTVSARRSFCSGL